jgi:glucan phosphoethanolaminetransferase (alkaline phosphatase superfamily)
MERVVLTVFKFFRSSFLLWFMALGILMVLAAGPLRDSPDWIHTLITVALAVLLVIVFTVAIVNAVEAGQSRRRP